MAKRSRRKREGLDSPGRNVRLPKAASQGDSARNWPRGWILLAGVAALAAIALVSAVLLSTSSPSKTASGRTIRWAKVPHLQAGFAPWSSGSTTLAERLPSAGLHELTMEGAVVHIHDHLDLYLDGKQIAVPALIGIGPFGNFLTEIHTHDSTGIIHVESPTTGSFTLGQFFCEWGVKLTRTCLGRYREQISWWVNGKKMVGDPAQLVLEPHQEIVIAAGRAPSHVPRSYTFPSGL